MGEDKKKQGLIEEILQKIKNLNSNARISDEDKVMILRRFFQVLETGRSIKKQL